MLLTLKNNEKRKRRDLNPWKTDYATTDFHALPSWVPLHLPFNKRMFLSKTVHFYSYKSLTKAFEDLNLKQVKFKVLWEQMSF